MPSAIAAGTSTTIDVVKDCSSGATLTSAQAGQALVDALQAVQDGFADNCTGLGSPSTPITGPYTLSLDPTYTYALSSINNYTDGPDGLPAVISNVTIESSQPGTLVTIARASGSPDFRLFDVVGPATATPTPEYQTPSDVQNGTITPVTTSDGSLTLIDVLLTGGLAQGGSGSGGGLGAGGAIFNHAGSVTLIDSQLEGNAAQGGAGVSIVDDVGGGGMGGNGGSFSAGGGMEYNGATLGNYIGGGPNGGSAGNPGGYGGGGGGGLYAGAGGFGGGGGTAGYNGGPGGFGGGGGSSTIGTAGTGGFGGGGGAPRGSGGYGGGSGSYFNGGAGAGMGGAIFSYAGTLDVEGSTLTGNSATGATGMGGAVFLYGNTGGGTTGQPASGPVNVSVVGSDITGNTNPGNQDIDSFGTVVGTLPGAATNLAFLTSPGPSVSGFALKSQPTVLVEDSNGNIVAGSSASVKLILTPGSGSYGAILSGTTTESAVNGVASFASLAVSTGGFGFTLTAMSQGLRDAISAPFDVQTYFAPLRLLDVTTPVSGAGTGSTPVGAPTGTVGQFFFDVLHSAGGIGYGIWSLKTGGLPPGLEFDASGALIGTPTQAGTYTFTAQVTDLAGETATHALTVTIFTAP